MLTDSTNLVLLESIFSTVIEPDLIFRSPLPNPSSTASSWSMLIFFSVKYFEIESKSSLFRKIFTFFKEFSNVSTNSEIFLINLSAFVSIS